MKFGWLALVLSFVMGKTFAYEYTIETVNGYTFYFVDTKIGDTATVMAASRNGFNHDPLNETGLSHWLEHCMLNGSPKFPNPKDCAMLAQKWSGSYNASTSFGNTNYRIMGISEVHLANAVEIVGDFISQPLLDPEVSMREREAVRNEVVKEYGAKDDIAFANLMRNLLVAPMHPLSTEFAGSAADIDNYSPARMKELWAANYKPEDMVFYVVGNFTKKPELKTEALEAAKKSLDSSLIGKTPTTISPAKNIKISLPFVNHPTPQEIVWMAPKDKKQKNLEIKFFINEDDLNKDPLARNILIGLLDLEIEGTLYDQLKKAGLMNSFGARAYNSSQVIEFTLTGDLTDTGIARIDEVITMIAAFIQNLKKTPIDETVLNLLKKQDKTTLKKAGKNPTQLAQILLRFNHLKDQKHREIPLHLEAALKAVTSESLMAEAARIFDPNQMFIGVMAEKIPAVAKEDRTGILKERNWVAQKSPVIKKAADLLSNKIAAAPLAPIVVKEVPLRETSLRVPETGEVYPRGNELTILKQDFNSTEAGVHILIRGNASTSQDFRVPLSSKLILAAFKERYKGELSYLDVLDLIQKITFDQNRGGFVLESRGQSDEVLDTLLFLISKLNDFKPTLAEIEIAKEEVEQSLISAGQTFAGVLAARASMEHTNPLSYSSEKGLNELAHLSLPTIYSIWKDIWENPSVEISGVGNISFNDLLNLRAQTKSIVEKNKFEQHLGPHYKNPFYSDPNLVDSKDIGDMGIALGFEFAGYQKDDLRLRVLAELLSTIVGEINRSKRQLGYVHQVFRSTLSAGNPSMEDKAYRTSLIFYGGVDAKTATTEEGKLAESLDRLNLTRSGWKKAVELVAGLREGDKEHETITDKIIQDVIEGELGSLKQEIVEKHTLANHRLSMMEAFGDPNALQQLIADMEALKPADIRELAKDLLKREGQEVFAVKSEARPCLWRLQDLHRLTSSPLDRSPLPKY